MKTTDVQPGRGGETAPSRMHQPTLVKGAAGQWKHHSKDGRTIDVEIYFHDLNYDGHRARLAIAQDVTEHNRLEIQLRHSQKLEAVGRLAAGIAHEINTPVQFIGDNLRFLRDGYTDLNKVHEKYKQLRDAMAHGEANQGLAEEASEAEKAVDLDYLKEEIPKAIGQSLDGVTRVATLVRAMKEFAHPDRKEKTAGDINEALLSTLIGRPQRVEVCGGGRNGLGRSATGFLQYRRIEPGLPQPAGKRLARDWRPEKRKRRERRHSGSDLDRGKCDLHLHCRHRMWHPRRHS